MTFELDPGILPGRHPLDDGEDHLGGVLGGGAGDARHSGEQATSRDLRSKVERFVSTARKIVQAEELHGAELLTGSHPFERELLGEREQ